MLAKFELRAELIVTADSSQYALEATLLQMKRGGQWQPVVYISRKLKEAERRCAQLEKEALAITWVCEKLDLYLVGSQFQIETDDKPLVKLLKGSDLASMPLRCQRFRLRLMKYQYDIFFTLGNQMYLADLFSRAAREPNRKDTMAGQKGRDAC